MALPNASAAFIDLRKLRDYALSSDNFQGRHKARVFASALGLKSDDAEWLREHILNEVVRADAVPRGRKAYGVLYEVDVLVHTSVARATVRTGWIVLSDEAFPRLTSCYVLR